MAFFDSDDSMRLQEEMIEYVVRRCVERRLPELTLLERDVSSVRDW
jgi:aspartyl/asparaginyl-tRNA synthetase